MRIMDLALEDSHGSWVTRWTPEWAVETAVKMNANVLNMMIVNEWGQAYWPSPHLPMQPELRGEDRLLAVADLAKEAGLRVSGMWGPSPAPVQSQRHPDWAHRTRDGEKTGWGAIADQRCFHICMNTPYEDLVNEAADQLFRDYSIDILALDYYYQDLCWCEHCRERCLADTGFDIFAVHVPFGREHLHWRWHEQRLDQQVLRIKETIGKYDGVLVTSRVAPGVDVIFKEPHTGDWLDLRDKGFMIRRDTGDGRATDKSVVTCTPYAHHYYVGWSKPPAHMRQEFRAIGIHGSNPWPVMWDWEIMRDPRGLEPLGTVFGELKSIEPQMTQARPVRHVALVFSDKLSGEKSRHVHEHGDAVKGFYDALTRSHVPFEMVRDDMLTADGLLGYSTLVLPNVWALSDEQVAAARQFVSYGGALVSTYGTSLYTGEGWDRYDFGLGDVFGVSYLSEHEAPWCYVTPRGAHPVFAHLDDGTGIPHGDLRQLVRRYQDEGENYRLTPVVAQIMTGEAANSGTHLKVEAGAEGQVIADLQATRKPRGSYFIKDVVPAIPGEPTGYPSVVVNRFGNGTSLYFAGQPDQLFNRQGHPDYERLLVNAVEWASPEPPVRVEAPKTIEATYWELEQGGYLVHLLNHTYDALFPAPPSATKVPASREVFRGITEVVPVHNVALHVKGAPASAKVLVGDADLTVEGTRVALAKLDEYAVVLVE
jgi:hypothetical protein